MKTREELLAALRENLIAAFPDLFAEDADNEAIAGAVTDLADQVTGKELPEGEKAEVDLEALIMALGLPEDATPEEVATTLRDIADMLVAPEEESPEGEGEPGAAAAAVAGRALGLRGMNNAAKTAQALRDHGRGAFKTQSGRKRRAPAQTGLAKKPTLGGMVLDILGGKTQGYTTGTLGGFLAHHEVSPEIIEYLYKNEIALKLGAQELQISGSESITFMVESGTSAAYWVGENKQVPESDGDWKLVTAYPKVLASRVMFPRKLLDNSQIVEARMRTAIPKSLSQELDRAIFYGHGAAESGNNTGAQPLGLKNITGVTQTLLATNGRVPTFQDLLAAEGRIEDANVQLDSGGWGFSPRTKRTFQGMTDADGNPVMTDRYANTPDSTLWGYPFETSTMIPNNLTKGTKSDCSDAFMGNWGDCAVVMSQNIEIAVDDRQYFNKMQVQILAYMYVDFLVFRTESFEILTGVRP